ncbi:hypothetical protein B0H12DRAFT_1246061 [Mycena haematopus]|nr:hypothetical protein B0H12DRAFT_1246061 [Mycena haematopus]
MAAVRLRLLLDLIPYHHRRRLYYQDTPSSPDAEPIVPQISDAAGQERFASLPSVLFRSADAAILLYDITALETLYALRRWWDDGRRVRSETTWIVIEDEFARRARFEAEASQQRRAFLGEDLWLQYQSQSGGSSVGDAWSDTSGSPVDDRAGRRAWVYGEDYDLSGSDRAEVEAALTDYSTDSTHSDEGTSSIERTRPIPSPNNELVCRALTGIMGTPFAEWVFTYCDRNGELYTATRPLPPSHYLSPNMFGQHTEALELAIQERAAELGCSIADVRQALYPGTEGTSSVVIRD